MKTKHLVSITMLVVIILGSSLFVSASDIDDRIVSSAQKSYVFKTYLKGEDIKITSDNAVVTLTGTVSDEPKKTLAQEFVTELPDVKSVNNMLEVKEKSSANSDRWLKTKVKTALLFHRNVSATETEVDIKNGFVLLRGNAENQAQKELTERYAKSVEGVKGVRNEMMVSKTPEKTHDSIGEQIDDASITAQIKTMLLFHHSTSALHTKVNTSNGVVTLTGETSNLAEKNLVEQLVSDINGVKSVNNQMTVVE